MNEILLNTCIKSNSKDHGAEIVKFYKDNGFDTRDMAGFSQKFIYYGVNERGLFDNESTEAGRRLIELPENGQLIPFEKDWCKATKVELLAEAVRRYPIGCTFKPENTVNHFVISDTYKFESNGHNNDYCKGTPFYIGTYEIKEPNRTSVLAVKKGGIGSGEYIFQNGKWAEVISVPKEKTAVVEPTKTYKVTREQFGKMHKLACSEWKGHIQTMVEETIGLFNNETELSFETVRKMFKALYNDEQKTLFKEIFDNFVDDKNAFIPKDTNKAAIDTMSQTIFGADIIQLIDTATPVDRPELRERAFYVNSSYEVKTGVAGSGTYIEIIKK